MCNHLFKSEKFLKFFFAVSKLQVVLERVNMNRLYRFPANITHSKSTMKTLEKGLKYIQS